MDALEFLSSQHSEIRALCNRLDGGTDTASRRARRLLAAHLCDLIATHMVCEERWFYPALESAATEEHLLRSSEEHLSAKRFIADLVRMDPDAWTFAPKLHVLAHQVLEHIEEEERLLFPLAHALLTREELLRIGADMEAHAGGLLAGEPRLRVLAETDSAAPIY